MSKETHKYLLDAIEILKRDVTPLLFLALIGLLFYAPTSSGNPSGFASVLPTFALFIMYPLIYGRYVEIVNDNRNISYIRIFKAHWLNFVVVSIAVASPILVLSFLGLIIGSPILGIRIILSIAVDIVSIYIFPLVFLLRERFTCIPLGIKCLLGNFTFSTPLVLLTLVPSVLGLLVKSVTAPLSTSQTIPAFYYLFWLMSIIIDFAIFIAATLILKEKLLKPPEGSV
ncbi:MAG TPA: hypothetical protein VMW89_14420 [Desulfatiglandales bacterium]|nr:hypothetical protein [Desulfatiglandales bacterium]